MIHAKTFLHAKAYGLLRAANVVLSEASRSMSDAGLDNAEIAACLRTLDRVTKKIGRTKVVVRA